MSRPEPVRLSRRTWTVFGAVLLATLVAEPFVHHHASFGLDGTPAFAAWFGFASCMAMVLVAKLVIGKLLARRDDYHDA
jgi:hypothetical protein